MIGEVVGRSLPILPEVLVNLILREAAVLGDRTWIMSIGSDGKEKRKFNLRSTFAERLGQHLNKKLAYMALNSRILVEIYPQYSHYGECCSLLESFADYRLIHQSVDGKMEIYYVEFEAVENSFAWICKTAVSPMSQFIFQKGIVYLDGERNHILKTQEGIMMMNEYSSIDGIDSIEYMTPYDVFIVARL